jgi:SAM-dependent methyltransferase
MSMNGSVSREAGQVADGIGQRLIQSETNAKLWSSGRFLKAYDQATLLPAETVILSRYREALTGRVLDVGCGAGRILDYLLLLDADVLAIDISTRMVEHCRQRFPGADVRVGDLADLKTTVEGPFDAVLMTDSVIDVFGDEQRRAVLTDVRELLAPGGLLVFSGHNLDRWDSGPPVRRSRLAAIAHDALRRSPASWIRMAIDFPTGRRNRRRLRSLQYREADYAVINDAAHHHGLLHYYIGRVGQVQQLSELGYEVVDVLESDGQAVPPGDPGHSISLYYVARPRPSAR